MTDKITINCDYFSRGSNYYSCKSLMCPIEVNIKNISGDINCRIPRSGEKIEAPVELNWVTFVLYGHLFRKDK